MLKTITQLKEPKGLSIYGNQSVAPVMGCEQ